MSIFEETRIIHSPLEDKYILEYKKWYGLWWKRDSDYYYDRDGSGESKQEALEKAKERASTLMARFVVWSKSNIYW
jgi:hypothetical protein